MVANLTAVMTPAHAIDTTKEIDTKSCRFPNDHSPLL